MARLKHYLEINMSLLTRNGVTMETVTVNKTQLLETLRANKNKHVAEYLEANELYKKAALKELQKMVKLAKKGQIVRNLPVELRTPVSHESDYTTAIEMLEWSVKDEIVIDQDTFLNFVKDQWNWKREFEATNTFYKASAFK